MSVPVRTTSLAALLAQAERRVARRLEGALSVADLSAEHWRVLTLLSDGAGHSMTEVASYAMVPAPTLTKIVDRMIERGLLYRRVDTADRRRVLVFVSARGSELYQGVGADVAEAERELIAELGQQDAAHLAELLNALLDRID